jgi:hypothetical protein
MPVQLPLFPEVPVKPRRPRKPLKKEKPSAVQEQGAATVPAQPGAAVGEGVGAEVPGQAPPTGKGAKLKRGKKAKTVKPLKPPAPPPPPPPPPPRKKPTLRVTQYNDGTFGLDWLDRGGRPAVERIYKTEAEARAAALRQFGPDEPVQEEVYVRPPPPPPPPAEVEEDTERQLKAQRFRELEEIAKTRVFTKTERDEYDALQSAYVLGEFEADLPPVPPEIRGQQLYPTGPVDPLVQLVLDDVEGRLVWADGQLALVEGFNRYSGDPSYVGVKGNVRWNGDLDTYSGNLFTEAELRRLKEARRAAIDFTEKATQRNPDGPFIGGAKLVFADDIKPRVAEVIRGWIPLLQLGDIRLVVTTPESGRRMAEGQYGRFWRIGKATLKGKDTRGVMQPLGNSDFHIALRPSVSTLQQLELAAHELGHILQRMSFEKLPVDTRAKIQADYDKWLAENKPKLANEAYRSLRAYRTGKATGGTFGFKTAAQVDSYFTSFGEWFADQVSRWATTQKKPLTVVDRFFKRLANALRKFFVGEREKFLPSGSMTEWLDSLSPDMKDALPNSPPPSTVETDRPKPEGDEAPPPPPTKTAEEIEAETAAARAEIEAERANAEAQWNNERLPSDVAFADLPAAAQKEWQESDRSGAAQIVITQKLLDDGYELDMTITERLNFALAAATAALDGANFAQFTAPTVVDVIVEVAYFTPGNYKKEQIDDALEFLSDPLEFSDAHLEAIADSFVDLAGGRTLEAKTKATKAGGEGGADKAWYTYAKNTPGVMQRLANRGVVFRMLTDEEARAYVESTVLSRQNLPDAQAKRLFGEEVSAKEDAESDPKNSPLTKLLRLITDINKSTVQYTEDLVKRRQRELKALYAKVSPLDLDTTQVSPFFDAAGNPYTISVNKVMRVVTKSEATKEEATRREAVLKEQEAANKATKTDTINSFDDFVRTEGKGKPGRNFVDIDGKPITKPLDLGRVRMVLANFLSKLVVKPKVYVYRSQADLKATNPRLYERAAAARPQGDFDRTPASGYAFGNNEVIIFTDRLKTEQQLRFVLAHETIGHIGLRSLIPKAQFDKLMLDIYERSPSVQKAVDASMEVRGLPKPEAVEEYLSDFAAALDVSIINRVWNAIKGALNRLGIKFGDEAARYWVNHAREYIRTGRSAMFTVQDVSRRSMRLRPARTQTTSAASPPRATCATTTSPPACSTTTWAGCPAALPKHGRPPRGSSAIGRMAGTGSRRRSSACSTSAPGRTPACLLWSGCSARRVVCRCRSRTRSTRSWPSSPTSPWPTSQRGCPGSVASRRTNWHRPTSCCTTHSGMLPAG